MSRFEPPDTHHWWDLIRNKSQEAIMAISIIPTEAVTRNEGEPRTTSLKVAESFNKLHKNVLLKIELLNCSPEFNRLNFKPVEYVDSKGETRRAYEMTKDGFIFLAMGFTGKKAAAIKEAYINAFNQMAEQLNRQPKKLSSDKTVRLRQAVDMLVSKKSIPYPACYRIVHHRFDVDHIDQLTPQQIPQAVEYIHKLAFDGEWLPPVDSPAVAAVPQFSAQDLYSFGLLLNRAEHMRLYIDSILPLLKIAEHRLYGPMREQADTARLDIARCIPLLERELHRDQDEFLVQLTQLMKRLHGWYECGTQWVPFFKYQPIRVGLMFLLPFQKTLRKLFAQKRIQWRQSTSKSMNLKASGHHL